MATSSHQAMEESAQESDCIAFAKYLNTKAHPWGTEFQQRMHKSPHMARGGGMGLDIDRCIIQEPILIYKLYCNSIIPKPKRTISLQVLLWGWGTFHSKFETNPPSHIEICAFKVFFIFLVVCSVAGMCHTVSKLIGKQ